MGNENALGERVKIIAALRQDFRWEFYMKLKVRGVRKVFEESKGLVALDGVSFDVLPGEFFCIIGPNGCGKSTLLHLIGGLLEPTAGKISIDGKPLSRPGPDRMFVFQELDQLLPWRTVAGNIEFGLEAIGVPKSKRKERVEKYIGLVGLDDFQDSYPHQLSGGMMQKVAIARALAVNPNILLMDEPFGSLDAQTRLFLQDELLKIWQETQKTILFVTHNAAEAVYLSDRIAVLTARPGRIKEIYRNPLPRPRRRDMKNTKPFRGLYEELEKALLPEVTKTLRRGVRQK